MEGGDEMSGKVVLSIVHKNSVGGGGSGRAAARLVVGVEAFLVSWMAWLMFYFSFGGHGGSVGREPRSECFICYGGCSNGCAWWL